MDTVRESPEVREVLGEAIRPEPVWWLNGDPWISGAVSSTLRIVHEILDACVPRAEFDQALLDSLDARQCRPELQGQGA